MLPLSERKLILLDLDGTVVDSQLGIFNGLYYMCEKGGVPPPAPDQLRSFIGPAIGTILRESYSLPPARVDELVAYYREYYAKQGLLECALYPGIEALLRALRAQGKRAAIATKKPEMFARRILCNLGLEPLLDGVYGASLSDKSDHKDGILLRALDELACTQKETALMVGDTRYDCIGARLAGVDCVGVDYGFGSARELFEHGALAVVKDCGELQALLCGTEKKNTIRDSIHKLYKR